MIEKEEGVGRDLISILMQGRELSELFFFSLQGDFLLKLYTRLILPL